MRLSPLLLALEGAAIGFAKTSLERRLQIQQAKAERAERAFRKQLVARARQKGRDRRKVRDKLAKEAKKEALRNGTYRDPKLKAKVLEEPLNVADTLSINNDRISSTVVKRRNL